MLKKIFRIGFYVIGILLLIIVVKGCNIQKDLKREVNRRNFLSKKEKMYQQEQKKLKEENEQLKEENKKLQQELANNKGEDSAFMNLLFTTDGEFYKEAYGDVQFYADSSCTQEINNVRFVSAKIISSEAENGLNIYCLRMDNGEICYCTKSPYLITEGKWEEMQEEERKKEERENK